MNRKKLHELLDLVLDLNEQGKTDAFFDFAGHVESLTVRVYKKGWRYDTEPDLDKYVYVDDEMGSPTSLDKIIKDLKKLKEGKTDEN